MRRILLLCVFVSTAALAAEPPGRPTAIGYSSVMAARQVLFADSGVMIRRKHGWTVIRDDKQHVIWSFTSEGHEAHPAAVKRKVVERSGQVFIEMDVLCEAKERACDRLVRQFRASNESLGQMMQPK